MVIDNHKEHILTNFQAVKNGGKAINTDHFTEYMDVDLKIVSEKPERLEIYNYKDEESQEKFKMLTSETDEFTNCFKNDKPLQKQVDDWFKVLKTFCQKSFNKIRIRKRKSQPIKASLANLIDKRNGLLNTEKNDDLIYEIEQEIAEKESEENRKVIDENFKHL